jgi:hypothetical protein
VALNILAKQNRGLLLDIFVFVLNIFLMRRLTRSFIDLFSLVSAEEPLAQLALSLVFLGLWGRKTSIAGAPG